MCRPQGLILMNASPMTFMSAFCLARPPVLRVCAALACAAVAHSAALAQLPSQPQMLGLPAGLSLPAGMPGALSVQGSQGLSEIAPQMPAGLQMSSGGAPVLPMRPDLGAQDAQRTPPLLPTAAHKPEAPTQFQRFVQEGTGKLLPLFGANLFEQQGIYNSVNAAPAPADHVLGQGDEVRVSITGAVEHMTVQTVDRNGQIHLPKVGAVQLSGVQVKDLDAVLRKQVATVFANVNVSASLGKLRGVTVYVVGQARHPGTYSLSSLSTLVNAVFASGGPNANGSMRRIELKRGGKTVNTLDLYDFIAKGDRTGDAMLQPGDVIMLAPAGPRVALTGATDHGAVYELAPGGKATTVQDLLALVGGVPALVNTQKALLERIDAQQPGAPRQVRHVTLDALGLNQPLRDGDVLTLLPMSAAFGNAVTLQGAVAQPLRHAWFKGMRVSDLIPTREALISPDFYKRRNQLVQNRIAALKAQGHSPEQIRALQRAQNLPEDLDLSAEAIAKTPGEARTLPSTAADRVRGFAEQINWEHAIIQRLNKGELSTELIAFNLGRAIVGKDEAHNLLLQPDDVITILSSADLRLPTVRQTRLVRLEGEIAAPGVYQALPGETLPQIIARAGGITGQAYLYGTEFTRESVRKLQQQNLDQIIRRLETQMQSAGATLSANMTGERAAQAQALQQQQQQQMQGQISRLKALHSKGRVALELDPTHMASTASDVADASSVRTAHLPDLPLEDGDAVTVPSFPSFVSAAGSVNNDNVMIYRPGKTVGDVLRAAAVAEDADPSEAFVLRADGSVLGRKSLGWFGRFESTLVMPGDTLIVPPKVDRESTYNFIVRGLRDWTQIFSNLGIGAAAIKSLKN